MPNGLAGVSIEQAAPVIQNGVSMAGGFGQRVAWEVSTPLGFIATAGVWGGGLLGSFIFDQPLAKALAMGLADSGATIAGWILTEQFLLGAGSMGAKTKISRTEGLGAGRGVDALSGGERVASNGHIPNMSALSAR